MAEQSPPAHEETIFTYSDKPNMATMISGGVFLAAAVYFIAGLFLGAYGIENQVIQIIIAILPILVSIRMGTQVNVKIKFDISTGYIEAENKEFKWEGYAHEPELFMVLEKTSEANGRTYKDYKLSLKADEETTFDVPIDTAEVRQAIQRVERVKKAVPLGK